MPEKIKCPERDSNPRHPDLMKGALTTELSRQPQWSESNISYKGTLITMHLLPDLSGWELLLLIVETKARRTRCKVDHFHFPAFVLLIGISELTSLMKNNICSKYAMLRTMCIW